MCSILLVVVPLAVSPRRVGTRPTYPLTPLGPASVLAGQYANLARNRPDAINLHAAVCGDFRTVHWHSAGSVGGIYEFMAPGFLEVRAVRVGSGML